MKKNLIIKIGVIATVVVAVGSMILNIVCLNKVSKLETKLQKEIDLRTGLWEEQYKLDKTIMRLMDFID